MNWNYAAIGLGLVTLGYLFTRSQGAGGSTVMRTETIESNSTANATAEFFRTGQAIAGVFAQAYSADRQRQGMEENRQISSTQRQSSQTVQGGPTQPYMMAAGNA